MFDNTLKWALVGVTFATFILSFAHVTPCGGLLVKCRSSSLLQCQRAMMLMFIIFLPVITHYALSLESFRVEVMKWQANEHHINRDSGRRPDFNHDRWNRYGAGIFATALVLLISLYTAYSSLTGALRAAQDESVQRKHGEEENCLFVPGAETIEAREKPVIKRVTFDLPDVPENNFVSMYTYLSNQLLRHKRRVVSFVLYALLVVFLLPAPLKHAFCFDIAKFKGITLTSDHVLVMFALYFCMELVLHNFSMTRPMAYSEVRFMASRFTLCYGAFLIILSVLALLQFNDTLKLFVYRMYEPHGTFKDIRTSFYDLSISNINIVSMILESYMMKYSLSLILNETSTQQRNEIIKSSLNIFSSVFSDCIACILFATMVVVPVVIGILV